MILSRWTTPQSLESLFGRWRLASLARVMAEASDAQVAAGLTDLTRNEPRAWALDAAVAVVLKDWHLVYYRLSEHPRRVRVWLAPLSSLSVVIAAEGQVDSGWGVLAELPPEHDQHGPCSEPQCGLESRTFLLATAINSRRPV